MLPPRLSEFATLVVARHWTQQFEWFMHVPLALKAGVTQDTIDALRDGRRPASHETPTRPASTTSPSNCCGSTASATRPTPRPWSASASRAWSISSALLGYFALVSMVLNVAHTPPERVAGVAELPPLPR